jgi:oxygen-independent coproporphyrinogen-3 oxidase
MSENTGLLGAEVLAAGDEAVQKLRALKALGLLPADGKFYPAILYPPLNMVPPCTAEDVVREERSSADGLYNVYLHVPFCLKRCEFCEIPVHAGATPEEKTSYVDAVIREMDDVMRRMGVQKLNTHAVLFGGGTPTAMAPELLNTMLDKFTARLDLSKCTQLSCDLDPATVLGAAGLERLHILKKHGVTRLAYGVQSMDDKILRRMNRAHDAAGVREAVARSKALGFKVNVELIFGYPGDTLETWARTVAEVIALPVDEVQIYRLKVIPYREQTNYLLSDYQADQAAYPNDEETIRMQGVATRMLIDGGFEENMRRFFTRKRDDRSHYFFNWTSRLEDQIGFGHTAFSHLGDRYYQNQRGLAGYMQKLEAGLSPIERGSVWGADTKLRRSFTLPLRYFEADRELFRAHTGRDLGDVFKTKVARLREAGLLESHPGGLRMTYWGSFFADEVAEQFHEAKHLPFPESGYAAGPLNPHKDKEI